MDAGGQESVKNYVDRMQAGLQQRLACAAREALRRCACGCARTSKLRGWGKAAAEEREFAG